MQSIFCQREEIILFTTTKNTFFCNQLSRRLVLLYGFAHGSTASKALNPVMDDLLHYATQTRLCPESCASLCNNKADEHM